MNTLEQRAKNIKLLICDVDGVLTDGRLFYSANGEMLKAFHVHDGLGLKLLQKAGVEVAIITSRHSKMVEIRMQQLGIEHVYQDQKIKTQALDELLTKLKLEASQAAYVGDDLPDLACMQQVGLSIAVKNAAPTVKQQAHWTTSTSGGSGAVREIAEMLLQAQSKWPLVLEQFSK